MGTALATLLALGLAVGAQEPSVEELRDRYRAIEARLASGETFEAARLELHAFYETLREHPSMSPAAVDWRARELAEDARLTPDAERRLELFVEAAEVIAPESADQAADMLQYRAELLHDLGRPAEACAALLEALDRYPDAKRKRPSLLVDLAEYSRRRGDLEAALGYVRTLDAEADDSPESVRAREQAHRIEALLQIDVGLPEIGARWLREWAARVEERGAEGEATEEELFEARLVLLRLARGLADHEGSVRQAELLLGDPYVQSSRSRRGLIELHLGIAELEEERTERLLGAAIPEHGADRIRRALEANLPRTDRVLGHTRLAEDHLDRGRLPQASAELERLAAASDDSVPLGLRVQGSELRARKALAEGASAEVLAARRDELLADWEALTAMWRRAPRGLEGVPFLKYAHRRALVSVLIELELALEPGPAGRERALGHVLAAQTLASLSDWTANAPVPGLADVQRTCLEGDARHGILLWMVARDRSHVFALDGERLTHHRLVAGVVLEEHRVAHLARLLIRGVESLPEPLRARQVERERREAAALGTALFPDDLRERIRPWTQLTVTGLDTLGIVPLAWTLVEGERLGARYPMTLLPTIPFWLRRRTEPARDVRGMALLHDALPSSRVRRDLGLERVSLGDATLERIATLWSDRLQVLAAEDASPRGLRRLPLDELALLQVFTHAIEPSGEASALVLTPAEETGLFRSSDVSALSGAPRVVVLTACGSGQAPVRRGDPLAASPVGAWLARGARTVIAAQDELSVREGRRLTRSLHEGLRERGESPAEALRRARVQLLEEDPELAPFRHGLLQVFGLGHEPLF